MNTALELTPEKTQKRIAQAMEMADIWEKSSTAVQMYLKGCIVTAQALSGNLHADSADKELIKSIGQRSNL